MLNIFAYRNIVTKRHQQRATYRGQGNLARSLNFYRDICIFSEYLKFPPQTKIATSKTLLASDLNEKLLEAVAIYKAIFVYVLPK